MAFHVISWLVKPLLEILSIWEGPKQKILMTIFNYIYITDTGKCSR